MRAFMQIWYTCFPHTSQRARNIETKSHHVDVTSLCCIDVYATLSARNVETTSHLTLHRSKCHVVMVGSSWLVTIIFFFVFQKFISLPETLTNEKTEKVRMTVLCHCDSQKNQNAGYMI